MIAVIILSIIIIVFFIKRQNISSPKEQSDMSKKQKTDISQDIRFTINGKELDLNATTENLSERRKRTYARDKSLTRHRRVWSILQYMVAYQELMQTDNFYNIRNAIQSYKEAKGLMRKEHVEEYDIEIAIRFCRMENHYDLCHHKLSQTDINNLKDWRNFQLNEKELYNNVISNYEFNWRSVLDSYKRINAKKDRLEYLIEDLDKIVGLPEIQEYPDVINRINVLKESYTKELDETIIIISSKKANK